MADCLGGASNDVKVRKKKEKEEVKNPKGPTESQGEKAEKPPVETVGRGTTTEQMSQPHNTTPDDRELQKQARPRAKKRQGKTYETVE